jgi:hypothetical protein
MRSPRIVMVYIEPTPYLAGLIEVLRRAHARRIEVYYITFISELEIAARN